MMTYIEEKETISRIQKTKSFQEAYSILKTISKPKKHTKIYTNVIQKAKTLNQVWIILDDLTNKNLPLNDKIFRSMLMKSKNDSQTMQLLEKADYSSQKWNGTTYRDILLKLKKAENVKDIFYQIKNLRAPTLDMYQLVIHKSNNFSDIIPYINEIKEQGLELDDRTCSSIINKTIYFSDAILFVYDMIDQGVKVRQKIYLRLIDLAENTNQWEELTTLLKKMDVFESNDVLLLYQEKQEKIISKENETESSKYEREIENQYPLKQVNIEALRARYSSLKEAETLTPQFYLIDWNEPLQDHLNFLAKEIGLVDLSIATGFLYKSGLKLISPCIDEVIKQQGSLKIIVGSLQKYNYILEKQTNKLHTMDKTTAEYLNVWMQQNPVEIKTIEERFFHGKFYILEGVEKSCVLIGSSNLSQSGLEGNQEMNLLYIVDTSSTIFYQFKYQFIDLWNQANVVDKIDPNLFAEMSKEQDHFSSISTLKKLPQSDIRQRIESLSEQQVKRRLKMWLQRNPTNIYAELGISSLKDYILFEYEEYDLLVFESFEAGNAYYYFRNVKVDELIPTIQPLSKTDIFEMCDMQKKGYHVRNESSLELKISSIFIRKINSVVTDS